MRKYHLIQFYGQHQNDNHYSSCFKKSKLVIESPLTMNYLRYVNFYGC